jgi:hypothetical protein
MLWLSRLPCLTLSLTCLPFAAALEEHGHAKTVDFYGSFGLTVAPDVEEDTQGPAGSSHYIWQHQKEDNGQRLAVGHLICDGGPQGGLAFGVEIAGSTTNITPRSYEVGGITFANTSSRTLRYTTAGLQLYGGYEFGINPERDDISAFFILAPFIGGGAAWADSEVRDLAGTYAGERGVGYYIEGGLRLGFFLTEKNWLLGLMVDGVIGTSTVKIDFAGGRSSELTLERSGICGAVVMGYRL